MPCWTSYTYATSTLEDLFSGVGDKQAFLQELAKALGLQSLPVGRRTYVPKVGGAYVTVRESGLAVEYTYSNQLQEVQKLIVEARRGYAVRKVNEAAKRLGWKVQTRARNKLLVTRRFS